MVSFPYKWRGVADSGDSSLQIYFFQTPHPVSDSSSHTERIKLLTHHGPGLVIDDQVFFLEAASLPDTPPPLSVQPCKPPTLYYSSSSALICHNAFFSLLVTRIIRCSMNDRLLVLQHKTSFIRTVSTVRTLIRQAATHSFFLFTPR